MSAPIAFQRWACGVAYAGSGFLGWQTQPTGERRAIQDLVETALAAITGHEVPTRCAGRTDAGVHAINQVIQFDSAVDRPATAWMRGTSAHLPPTVRIRWASPVASRFDARFDARDRTYWYVLHDGAAPSPIWLNRCAHASRRIDLGRITEASKALLGTHDFSAFRSSECQAQSPVRDIREIRWRRQGDFVLMSITANAFLHHMVRNLMGSLVYVGDGRRDESWLQEVLDARDRALAAPTCDAAGLYLAGVRYDPDLALASRPPDFDLCALA